MRTFLILLLSAMLLMGCVVPEISEVPDDNNVLEVTIVSFVQEINSNGTLYRALGGMSCTVLCNLVAQNCSCAVICPDCPECPVCEDCEECQVCENCEICEDCEICEECEDCDNCAVCPECPVNPCWGYFALRNLFVTVRAEGTGSIDELCFLITYNDDTTSSTCIDVEWDVDGVDEREFEVEVSGRVVFVTLN